MAPPGMMRVSLGTVPNPRVQLSRVRRSRRRSRTIATSSMYGWRPSGSSTVCSTIAFPAILMSCLGMPRPTCARRCRPRGSRHAIARGRRLLPRGVLSRSRWRRSRPRRRTHPQAEVRISDGAPPGRWSSPATDPPPRIRKRRRFGVPPSARSKIATPIRKSKAFPRLITPPLREGGGTDDNGEVQHGQHLAAGDPAHRSRRGYRAACDECAAARRASGQLQQRAA